MSHIFLCWRLWALSAPCDGPPRGNDGWLRCSHGPCSPVLPCAPLWSPVVTWAPRLSPGVRPASRCHWWWCWQHWAHPDTGPGLQTSAHTLTCSLWHVRPGHPACWPGHRVSPATKHTIVPQLSCTGDTTQLCAPSAHIGQECVYPRVNASQR